VYGAQLEDDGKRRSPTAYGKYFIEPLPVMRDLGVLLDIETHVIKVETVC